MKFPYINNEESVFESNLQMFMWNELQCNEFGEYVRGDNTIRNK